MPGQVAGGERPVVSTWRASQGACRQCRGSRSGSRGKTDRVRLRRPARNRRRPAVANLAALLIGLFIPAVYYDGTLEKTTLCLVLSTGALVLYFGASPRSLVLSGMGLGLAVLSRGNLLLFVVLGAVALASHPAAD